ncbi:MarR family winged helix-turn-helix transcriptional regulator [Candidatus Enterococcus ikei]|uniref:MarR family transcriptional regulator n=1 Tax=Candidatus Enterococcus ikei TaxID=2815326 RepID=A0ABS3GW14_9ENTE|nr:MarR family transcriptional regulator [Enterococcus sp. DIV0869a]MBO0439453.1 MarR family transcriptional regulator [Enterococcus sp. DIV0869a]
MEENQYFQQLLESFIRVNNELSDVQKLPIMFPNGIRLNTGAVHLIEAIGRYPNMNTTKLATILGITKGAISQQIPRLEKLGLIMKHKDEKNRKEIFFTLTDLGNQIFLYHEKLHEELYSSLIKDLNELTETEIKTLSNMLNRISTSITDYQQKLT